MWCVLLAPDGEEEEGGDEEELVAEVEDEEVDEGEELDGGSIGKMCFIPLDWLAPRAIFSLPVLTAYRPGVSEKGSIFIYFYFISSPVFIILNVCLFFLLKKLTVCE